MIVIAVLGLVTLALLTFGVLSSAGYLVHIKEGLERLAEAIEAQNAYYGIDREEDPSE